MDRILLIDDDQNLLKVVMMRLEANGYQVATATEAETALEIAKEKEIDLPWWILNLPGKMESR